ncbi:hypothetical protein PENFLA_c004G06128 [Penicillium flavigenum]|uniref:non-specific serine/threonine protein kinase n=1 Tax=Penicillium flavigenum TaxID=254877 RepID=A0A1V6TSM2_9EURO|nr:hypothetical protein PENFLA_c004G06128 [Penicillium flavigenum]
MSKLLSLSIRLLRRHDLCYQVDSSVILRKGRVPPLHHDQPRRAFTATTFNSIETNDDVEADVLYEPLEGIETLENYRPGGYHPIQIGDQFHTNSNPKEVDIVSTILTRPHYSPTNKPGKTMVPSILDRFTIHGPNGNHACYATAPARASLSGLKDGGWTRLFQPDVARSLAAQLVLVLDYVHAQGIVHSDVHLGNILLKVAPDFDQLSLEQLYEKYGAPERDPVVHLDGKPLPPGVPSHGIVPIWLGEASEKITLAEARFLLTDFGESFSPSKEPKYESHTPLVSRPPEARFEPDKPLSFSSDIWSLACTIWSIIAQRPLFEGFMATEDYMTCEQVDTLGILPSEWWSRWEARQEKFTEEGKPINRKYYRSWDDRFKDSIEGPRRDRKIPSFDTRERDAIFNLLRQMLSFRPEDRPTTKQILESEWMVKWALPQYGKIKSNV